jgi:hypothetical protein
MRTVESEGRQCTKLSGVLGVDAPPRPLHPPLQLERAEADLPLLRLRGGLATRTEVPLANGHSCTRTLFSFLFQVLAGLQVDWHDARARCEQ